MSFKLRFLTVFFVPAVSVACSGASDGIGAPSPDAGPEPLTCAATAITDACTLARAAFSVAPLGVDVAQTNGGLNVGDAIVVHAQFRNASSTDGWSYPGLVVSADDERIDVTGETGPDLYGLGACRTSNVSHALGVRAPIESGTKITLTLEPLVPDGSGLSTCEDTLGHTTLTVVVP